MKGHFSNIDLRIYQNALQYTNVVQYFPLTLPAGASDVYYKDHIGNVSTSNFRPGGKKGSSLDIRPRYPLYGGWKYDFFYGFNVESSNFLNCDGGDYELTLVMFDSIKNVSYNTAELTVQLPEGARFFI